MKRRSGAAAGMLAGVGVLGLVVLSLGTPQGCGETSEDLIGSEGGILISRDGRLTLEIPPGALAHAIEISVHEVACTQEGQAACYDIRPAGVTFELPAKATFEAAELMSMESVSFTVHGAQGWQPLADIRLDRDNELIEASVLYLSSLSVEAR